MADPETGLIFLVRRLGPHLPAIPRWSSPSLLPFPSLISPVRSNRASCPHDCSRVLPNLPVFPPCLLTSAVLILYAAPLYPLKKLRTVASPTPPSPSFRGSPAPEVFQRPPPPATRLRTMAWTWRWLWCFVPRHLEVRPVFGYSDARAQAEFGPSR